MRAEGRSRQHIEARSIAKLLVPGALELETINCRAQSPRPRRTRLDGRVRGKHIDTGARVDRIAEDQCYPHSELGG